MGKAPVLQLKACSAENAFPQMQLVGKNGGVHAPVPEEDSISECSFVQSKAHVLNG